MSYCHILLARCMGHGAYNGLQQMGIQLIITDIPEIENAEHAVIDENIEDHPDRLD